MATEILKNRFSGKRSAARINNRTKHVGNIRRYRRQACRHVRKCQLRVPTLHGWREAKNQAYLSRLQRSTPNFECCMRFDPETSIIISINDNWTLVTVKSAGIADW